MISQVGPSGKVFKCTRRYTVCSPEVKGHDELTWVWRKKMHANWGICVCVHSVLKVQPASHMMSSDVKLVSGRNECGIDRTSSRILTSRLSEPCSHRFVCGVDTLSRLSTVKKTSRSNVIYSWNRLQSDPLDVSLSVALKLMGGGGDSV